MDATINLKRTTSMDPDFQLLIRCLDHELWNELKEDQALYDQFNKVEGLKTAIVLYVNEQPAACGCFKAYGKETVEIKRMFVKKEFRRKGLSIAVLEELENWALESGYSYAVLETSVHFQPARALYTGAGYSIIENYDQYKGLDDSVCMKKKLLPVKPPSEFMGQPGIEYFQFEEEFVEKNIRCIPMIVRLKMDKAGIKLKLDEWSKFTVHERLELASLPCESGNEIIIYKEYLCGLVKKYTNREAAPLEVDKNPEWMMQYRIPSQVTKKLGDHGAQISIDQWRDLSRLQRFALVKLSRPGHEAKNFVKAAREFGLN